MRIWLTGGSGSGKSTVSVLFQKHGFLLVDADAISREIAKKGTPCYAALLSEFGTGFLKANGELDRKALGNAVFQDKEKLLRLNAITHTYIIKEMLLRAEGHKNVVMDAPLPNTFGVPVDKTLYVTAPPALRAKRIMARDGLTKEEAERRIRAQSADSVYEKDADAVLINDGDLESLSRAAKQYIKEWYEL